MKSRRIIGLLLAVVVIGALLWFAPNIISYLQNLTNSSDASYTSLTLREEMNNTATIEFGDTDYTFVYLSSSLGGDLSVSTFIGGQNYHHPVNTGDTYTDFRVEVKVSNVSSDYISNYVVILVKPTMLNYSASLMYTKVNLTLGQTKTVSISSGLVNKTNQYSFSYAQGMFYKSSIVQLTIVTNSQGTTYQEKTYPLVEGGGVTDLGIEVRVYKIELQNLVIYVKPLY